MQRATSVLVIASCLVLSAAAWAKRPEPVTCPEDIGTALGDTCPCAGKLLPDGVTVQPWKNHGQYVSCVVHYRNALRKAGCFEDDAYRRTLARCAARSTCGKENRLRCCTYVPGTCTGDPAPGDLAPEGTCDNDVSVACDLDADCTTSTARIVKDADECTTDGSVVVEGGSVCETCPPPPPAQ